MTAMRLRGRALDQAKVLHCEGNNHDGVRASHNVHDLLRPVKQACHLCRNACRVEKHEGLHCQCLSLIYTHRKSRVKAKPRHRAGAHVAHYLSLPFWRSDQRSRSDESSRQ